MNREGNFGVSEAVSLTTLLMISKALYTSTSVATQSVGTTAWYMTLVSCATAIVFFLLIYLLMKRFPGKNIIEVFEAVLGKIIGKFIGLFFSAYILYYAGSSLREFVEMIKAYNLPLTPPSIILVSFIAVTILIAYIGLEGIARLSYLCIFLILGGLFFLLVLAYPNYNIEYLKPYLGYGLGKTIYTGIMRSSAYEEVFTLAIIINSIHGLKNFKKAGLISLILSGLIFSISAVCYLMAFQYTMGAENLSGIFQLSRTIFFNRFIQRLESVFLFTWTISSLINVSVAFYISISVYCKSFNINNHKPLLLPFAYLMFMIAILPKNLMEVIQVNMLFIRQYSFTFNFGIPVLVLLIAIITGKKGGQVKGEKA